MNEKEIIVGYISNYVYQASDSLYKVCTLITKNDEEITITGSFPRLEDGLNYEFVGVRINHPKYGEQFVVESYAKSESFTEEGLIMYLSSDHFTGIGPKIASAIVNKLGLDCINKILDDPECLDGVHNMTEGRKKVIYETLKENFQSEQVFVRLYGFGLTSKMIYKLYEAYGLNAANRIEENPYCLIYEVDGFGFKKSDALALNLGFSIDDPRRIKAAIIYTLNTICYQQGFTFLTKEQLLNSSKGLLNHDLEIKDYLYENALEMLEESKEIIFEDDHYFEPSIYKAECNLANKILKISKTKGKEYKADKIKALLPEVEKELDVIYTPLQKEAIINALSSKLSIITGGPGTGKSTILNGILAIYAALNNLTIASDEMSYLVLLAAPTGRAAKRMAEATHFKATTIHKALGYNFDGNFTYNENYLFTTSLVIIDEASMLDVNLAASLFQAIPPSAKVILVGDANQLPSVGPGNVLYDLMASNVFNTTRLTQIMRQAKDSDIISLSQMVLSERVEYNIFSKKKEIFFYDCEAKTILDILFRIMDNYVKAGNDIHSGIQILIPMYAGVAGIDAINAAIQARYNPEESKILVRDNQLFKKNDKVLQLKNDPELNIMNGDIGKIMDIVKIDDKDVMLIDFDGRVINYKASDCDNLKLAYAISIHKAQGSEFDNVIMPILPSYQIMLRKKLVYTGITRAKKKLIILGKLQSLESSLHTEEYLRQTSLIKRVSENKKEGISIRIYDPEIPFDTLGEVGMEGITPYSFMEKK